MGQVLNEALALANPPTRCQSSVLEERNSKSINKVPRTTLLVGEEGGDCVGLGFFSSSVFFVLLDSSVAPPWCYPMPHLRSSTVLLEEAGSTLHNSRPRCAHWSLWKRSFCANVHTSAPWEKPWEGPPATPTTTISFVSLSQLPPNSA